MRIISWRPWSDIPLEFQTNKQRIHTILFFCASIWCILYIGIVGLYSYFTSTIAIQKSAVAILIDTSISMSANDVTPNRYRHALAIATGLMESYNANYITIPFGGLPIVRTPRSQDIKGISTVVTQYNLGSYHVNQAYMGSAPGNAIGLARDYLKKHPIAKKTIVLLGDGNTNTGYTIDAFLPYLVQDKIELLICAMGNTENVLGKNHADSPIVNAIDLDRLTYITKQTNGKRWVCNDKDKAIESLSLKLREGGLHITDLDISGTMRNMRNNTVLHFVSIISILYILITSVRGFVWYIFYTEE